MIIQATGIPVINQDVRTEREEMDSTAYADAVKSVRCAAMRPPRR